MKKPQHLLFITKPPVEHEILIIIEIFITYCSTYYLGYYNTRKVEKLRIHTLNIDCSGPFSVLDNKYKDNEPSLNIFVEYKGKPDDDIYIT